MPAWCAEQRQVQRGHPHLRIRDSNASSAESPESTLKHVALAALVQCELEQMDDPPYGHSPLRSSCAEVGAVSANSSCRYCETKGRALGRKREVRPLPELGGTGPRLQGIAVAETPVLASFLFASSRKGATSASDPMGQPLHSAGSPCRSEFDGACNVCERSEIPAFQFTVPGTAHRFCQMTKFVIAKLRHANNKSILFTTWSSALASIHRGTRHLMSMARAALVVRRTRAKRKRNLSSCAGRWRCNAFPSEIMILILEQYFDKLRPREPCIEARILLLSFGCRS